jgi:hypothetical protein
MHLAARNARQPIANRYGDRNSRIADLSETVKLYRQQRCISDQDADSDITVANAMCNFNKVVICAST